MKRPLVIACLIILAMSAPIHSASKQVPDFLYLSPERRDAAVDVITGMVKTIQEQLAVDYGVRGKVSAHISDNDGDLVITGVIAARNPQRYRMVYTSPLPMVGGKVYWYNPLAATIKRGARNPRIQVREPVALQPVLELLFQPETWLDEQLFTTLELVPTEEAELYSVHFASPELGLNGFLTVDRITHFPRSIELEFTSAGLKEEIGEIRYVQVPEEVVAHADLEEFRQNYQAAMQLMEVGKYAAAVEKLLAMIRIDPYNVLAHANLGYCHAELGNDGAAVAEFEQILMLEEDSPLALNNLAYLYITSNMYVEKGLELAERAVELDPQNGAYLDTLGWGYYKIGNYKRAAVTLEKAINLMADQEGAARAELHYHLAMVYWELGKMEAAIEHLEVALQRDPAFEEAEKQLQLWQQGNPNRDMEETS